MSERSVRFFLVVGDRHEDLTLSPISGLAVSSSGGSEWLNMVVELRSLEENLGSMLFSRSSRVLEGKQNFAAPPCLLWREKKIRYDWVGVSVQVSVYFSRH